MVFFYSLLLIWHFFSDYKLNAGYWAISSLIIGAYLVYKFFTSAFIKQYIPYQLLRLYTGYVICLVPVLSFSTGRVFALNIYNNKDIRHIIIVASQANNASADTIRSNKSIQSLKFLGFLGDKVIASSLDNKKITFINQSSFSQIELVQADTNTKHLHSFDDSVQTKNPIPQANAHDTLPNDKQ